MTRVLPGTDRATSQGATVRLATALAWRDLRRAFSNPLGYVFTTIFILLSATAAFWRPRFFLDSLATLDQLNEVYPYILMFFVPALTMNAWADERRQGTDELLLTLPGSELAIVLGKYLAAAGVYTVAVLVSLSHVVVLALLGRPDPGLMLANYLGFWLSGLALIPAGMLASLLTANATIAFVTASLFCAIPIGLEPIVGTVGQGWSSALQVALLRPHFAPFSRGLVSVTSVLFFAGMTAWLLALATVVLSRRRWRYQAGRFPRAGHMLARLLAAAIILGCVVELSGRTRLRVDLTAERQSTLSEPTLALLRSLPAGRSVFIQAFLTPNMPPSLVQTRENVVDALNGMAAASGGRVSVAIQDTEPYSATATLARERFSIVPRTVADSTAGGAGQDVFLGIAVTSGLQEQVIAFVDPGLSVEYEVARALRVVTQGARKRLGVLDTDIKLLGGVDFRTGQTRPAWAIVQELRAQYDVVEVTPANAADVTVDALLMVMPSRLTQTDLSLAMEPIRRGVPTLMLLDPLPTTDLSLAPAADLANEVNPFRRDAPQVRIVYGNIREALERFGINWTPARVAWDAFNPHPDLAELPRESVFVNAGNGGTEPINRSNPATASIQEVLLLYPGYVLPQQAPGITMQPLLTTGTISGSSSFFDLVKPSASGLALDPNPSREPDGREYVLAARVYSGAPLSEATGARPLNLIVVADSDFISDAFFSIRAAAGSLARFDNIRFFENAVDFLAGDSSFIALRDRQPRYRTLERLEAQTRTFVEQRTAEEQRAQKEAASALETARGRLASRLEAVSARADIDASAKRVIARNLQETESRQLRVLEDAITRARDARVRASREEMEAQVRATRMRVQILAVTLPPAPVLLFGLAVFVRRQRLLRQSALEAGRLKVNQ